MSGRSRKLKHRALTVDYDGLNQLIGRRPTIAVMTKEQANRFNVPGLKIVKTYHTMEGTNLKKTISQAIMKTQAKKINLLMNGQLKPVEVPLYVRRHGVVRPVKNIQRHRHFGKPDFRHHIGSVKMSADFGLELGSDTDGTPVVVIITSTQEMPPFKIKHVVRKHKNENEDEDEDSKPKRRRRVHGCVDDKHTFLKEPLTDDILIEAMKKADADLLGEGHTAQVKWEEDHSHHERSYNDHHLLVCLYLYIYFHQLYSTPQFYSDQRKQFYDFCSSRLPDDFVFNELRSFQKAINQLQVRHISFEVYYNRTEKPNDWYEKEKASLPMWYAIYCKAALSFEKVLFPETKE